MKKIDEVIELFDNGCIRPCVECPCYGMKECQEQLAAESFYLHKYQKIEEEYEKHAENVPLTWDELKQMEGKPVWLEEHSYFTKEWLDGYWLIVSQIEEEYIVFSPWQMNMRNEIDATWRAYRKERK